MIAADAPMACARCHPTGRPAVGRLLGSLGLLALVAGCGSGGDTAPGGIATPAPRADFGGGSIGPPRPPQPARPARPGLAEASHRPDSADTGTPTVLLQPLAAVSAAEQAAGRDLVTLLRRNLARTAMIRPLLDRTAPTGVAMPGTTAAGGPAAAGVTMTGSVETGGDGRLRVEIELWDHTTRRRIDRFAYPVPRGRLRRIGHVLSDDAYRSVLRFYRRPTPGPGLFDSRIAFVDLGIGSATDAARSGRLVVIDQDGFNRRIVRTPGPVRAAGFADSGREVVLLAGGTVPTAYLLDLATLQTETLGRFPGMVEPPRFPIRGDKLLLAFAPDTAGGNRDVYLQVPPWRRPARALTRLTDHPAPDYAPDLSPDGTLLVFVSERSGSPHLWIKRMTDGAPVALSRGSSRFSNPVWSPAGDRIAAVETRPEGSRLVVLVPEGGPARPLATCRRDSRPSWAPNGELLAFVDPDGALAVVDDRDRQVDILTNGRRVAMPAWSPLLQPPRGG